MTGPPAAHLDFSCPACGRVYPATLRQLERDPILACPECGEHWAPTSAEVAAAMEDLERHAARIREADRK